MDKVFLRYLDPAFRYVKSQNPALVRCRDDALRDGLNCVALAQLVICDLFGYMLPAHLQALELVRDLAYFEPVPDPGRMRAGDLVWLGVDRPKSSFTAAGLARLAAPEGAGNGGPGSTPKSPGPVAFG